MIANVTTQTKRQSWQSINWRRQNRNVTNLRQRIYRASQEGDVRRARNLQKLMMQSKANRLLAVRRVTQLNQGRRSAGVDQTVVKTNAEREHLVDTLKRYTPRAVRPVKRVFIPKKGGKLRPLGLPTVIDRCQQAIIKSALEPYWEAKFEATSYGFRPGRSAHDAIQRIHNTVRWETRRWVLDADIEGAFDHVSHDFLERRIGNFPGRQWIRAWLRAGVMEQGEKRPTWEGTPQGGIASPLMLNIVLHGMEQAVGVRHNCKAKGTLRTRSPAVIRYADDCVGLTCTKRECNQVKTNLQKWLAQRGLKLSPSKTRIVHVKKGFDFLGFTIRRYASRARRGKAICLTHPSRETVWTFRQTMRSAWRKGLGLTLSEIVRILNPQVRGWGNYFRIGSARRTFQSLDAWMWRRQERFVARRHPNKSWWWKKQRYWGKISARQDKWVFMDKPTGRYLWKLEWTPIRRHVLIRGRVSPDDPTLREYWEKRRAKPPVERSRISRELWRRQRGKCLVCGAPLGNGEKLERHHIKPKRLGGEDRTDNLCLIHNVCHKQVHAAHPEQPLGARRLLEPCAGLTGKHGSEGGKAPPSPR
ncbi:MAG: group II intron reverse transcriptase/maturase [Myxococcota bacterium]